MHFKSFISWLIRVITGKKAPLKNLYIEELSDCLKNNYIYILGEGDYLWEAVMLCPCGCGELLHMSLHKNGSPKWNLEKHKNGTVSLSPSIWRKKGCCSHFFIEKGFVVWVKN